MKTRIALFFLVFSPFLAAQDDDMVHLRAAEVKSALNQMQFRANPNTGNYDLKYHRLELEVDPSVAFISGQVTTYYEALSNLDQIVFDLADNMTVSQVLQRGQPLAFSQNNADE